MEELRNKILAQQNNIDGIINNAGIIQPFVKINELGYHAIESATKKRMLSSYKMETMGFKFDGVKE